MTNLQLPLVSHQSLVNGHKCLFRSVLVRFSILTVVLAHTSQGSARAAQPGNTPGPDASDVDTFADASLFAAVQARIDEGVDRGTNRSIVVGLIFPGGTRFLKSGTFREGDTRAVNDRTVYETANVTEVFTGLATAIAVGNGLFSWQDAIEDILGSKWKIPAYEGKRITLQHLAQHASGLPALPENFQPATRYNPLSEYSRDDLAKFLAAYSLSAAPGSTQQHSMIGMALLGYAVEAKSGMAFEAFLQREIFEPIGMPSTSITLNEIQRFHYARGHVGEDQTPLWSAPAFEGSSGVRSNVRDLLRFVGANLGLEETPLAGVLAQSQERTANLNEDNVEFGKNWFIAEGGSGALYFRSGNTAGHASFIGFNKDRRIGVVALSNSAARVDNLGFHLLDPEHIPLTPSRKLFDVSARHLAAYTGAFFMLPNGRQLLITKYADKLYAQIDRLNRHQVLPVERDVFYYPYLRSNLNFLRDKAGTVEKITFIIEGEEVEAKRVKISG